MSRTWWAVVMLMAGTGCGDEADTADTSTTDSSTTDSATTDSSTSTDTSTTDTISGGCDATPGGVGPRFDQTASRFTLRVNPSYSWLDGGVQDGAPLELHVEAEREGICRLLRYTPSQCTPECDFVDVCVDGACRAYPGWVPVGDVTLAGVAPSPVTLTPDVVGRYAWDTQADPVIDDVSLAAAGGTLGAFSLATCAPTELVPAGDWSAALEARADGEDVTLSWGTSEAGARVYIRMTTGIGTHGGISPIEVECEGPDTGSLTLPGSFLDALYAEGWSCGECGDNRLVRYRAAETSAGPSTIQLRIEQSASFWYRP